MVKLWNINQLRSTVALALEEIDYTGPPSSRVRAVPDTRTIRYYTTLGMIDKPAEMRGRTAYYDKRHVVQIVAIKKLQAEGMALNAIQQKLASLTDRKIVRLATIPNTFWEKVSAKITQTQSNAASELTSARNSVKRKKARSNSSSTDRSKTDFWASPIETESAPRGASPRFQPIGSVRIEIQPGIFLVIDETNDLTVEQLSQRLQSESAQAAIQAIQKSITNRQ